MKIFVSYATKDQELIRDIVSTLEADGHEVWWDRNLIAGDNFRDEIVRALEGADIVLVVWTDISIGSSWVISEAGRAAQAGKLVAVRTPALPIEKLPPPFDVYHTEVLHDLEAVRKSVEVGRSSGAERSNIVRRRGANFLLHKHNCYGLASLANLDKLPAKGAILIAAPLKIKHGTGSPIRALALVPKG